METKLSWPIEIVDTKGIIEFDFVTIPHMIRSDIKKLEHCKSINHLSTIQK